ncbi:MAG: hypothetical protein M3461_18540 [Pseudomonadota bacterium]|nr:hypothetical protein [Pseudomonadota bacterium]
MLGLFEQDLGEVDVVAIQLVVRLDPDDEVSRLAIDRVLEVLADPPELGGFAAAPLIRP